MFKLDVKYHCQVYMRYKAFTSLVTPSKQAEFSLQKWRKENVIFQRYEKHQEVEKPLLTGQEIEIIKYYSSVCP